MKIIKKIAAIMLSVMMVLGMCSVVGAEGAGATSGTSAPTGSIKISNAIVKQEYKIYRILELESYDKTNGLYSYKPNSSWEAFFDDKSDPKGAGSDYITVDDNGYARWKGAETDERKREFAKLALEYAKDKKISENAKATAKASGEGVTTTELTFPELQLGYYLVDSSAGALCSLNTTNPNVTIEEKNGVPSVKKEVSKTESGTYEGKSTASIGDTVYFKTTITAQAGAQNYVLHDKMEKGLTFDKIISIKDKTGDVDQSNYTPKIRGENNSGIIDDCTFEIEFKEDFCKNLGKDDEIIVTYSAILNKDATIAGDGNKNETWLKYGDKSETTHAKTITKTYEIPVFKYTGTDKPLAGAKFTLKKEGSSDAISLISIATPSEKQGDFYRVAVTGEKGNSTVTTGNTGKFTIQGLDAGTYYLTETQQPAGYNKLKDPIKIKIDEAGVIKVVTDKEDEVTEVKVLNKTGSILPSTGGMGTTLFYIFGAILVIGSGVVLITKKRMK